MARFFHAGLWILPADLERALLFYQTLLGFDIISRSPRKTGGERIFLRAHGTQYLELLISNEVSPFEEIGLHPLERVSGIPHLSFIVEDLNALRDKVKEHGFEILKTVPQDLSGFVKSENGEHRMLFVRGPGNTSVEIFEFKQSTYRLP